MAGAGVVMLLDILRHGHALPADPGGADADRSLSPEGREQVKNVAEQARDAGVKPSLMIASRYLRAGQTAEIAAEILGYTEAIERSALLGPGDSPFDLWDDLRRRSGESEILIVGHLPLLGDLASLLLKQNVRITPGMMLRIEVPELVPEPGGVLQWKLPAETAQS
jgi:phosphohistidine phosphatase